MLNLISCELLKLKRSKMVLISVAGVLSTPLLMLIEALQTHFDKPEIIFTLSDIYSDSVLYIMLLVNIMIYVARITIRLSERRERPGAKFDIVEYWQVIRNNEYIS